LSLLSPTGCQQPFKQFPSICSAEIIDVSLTDQIRDPLVADGSLALS
jgi:hypothetical protein